MPCRGAILVFDNDRSILDLLTDILIDEGYAVRAILDGAPGRTARAEQPPALIVLDLALPARTVAAVRAYARGYDLADVPVVITTTSAALAAADRAAGGGESLLKPFDLDDLLACVAQRLDESFVLVGHRGEVGLQRADALLEHPQVWRTVGKAAAQHRDLVLEDADLLDEVILVARALLATTGVVVGRLVSRHRPHLLLGVI